MAFLPLEPTSPAADNPAMRIEILLYDGFDDLDAFGPYEVLTGAGLDTRFVTLEPCDAVTTSHGARVIPEGVLGDPDLVLVPGGGWSDRNAAGARAEAERGAIPEALARRHAAGGRVGSVCTGAMLLASAGLLRGRPAVTHHSAHDDLRAAGADVREDERFVDDGDIVTAAGVTSGIDLALHLVSEARGERAAQAAAREIEWQREPKGVRPL
jgi:transcriptional regulator GlxA family with amidase domain